MISSNFLEEAVDKEKSKKDYLYSDYDAAILKEMLSKMNRKFNTDVNYLAEIDMFNIQGAGNIYIEYISKFHSESLRAYLIPQIVIDKVPNCVEIIYDLYLNFRISKEAHHSSNCSSPAHIYAKYDFAFSKLKPKKLSNELADIVKNPLDAFYLPFTIKMLASWKIPSLYCTLLSFLDYENIPSESLGSKSQAKLDTAFVNFMERELIFRGLSGLKYYQTEDTIKVVERFLNNTDKDISIIALKTYKSLLRSK